MARLRDLFRMAESLGAQHGAMAASWYFDGCKELKREDFVKVLKGIRDGDPEILDTFQSAPLSGEHADDMTPKRLWDEIGAKEQQRIVAGDEINERYEQGYNRSYADCVENECKEMLTREVTFHVVINLCEEDVSQIESDISELLVGKYNTADIPDITVEDSVW